MNTQLLRAEGFLKNTISALERVQDIVAIFKRDADLSVDAHMVFIGELHSIETSTRLARESIMESVRRKLRDE